MIVGNRLREEGERKKKMNAGDKGGGTGGRQGLASKTRL